MKTPNHLLLFIAAIIIIDQITKWFAFKMLTEPVWIFDHIGFKLAFNKGVAFSLPVEGIWALVVPVMIIVLIVWYAYRHLEMIRLESIGIISLIIGGALSNVIDRVRIGHVIDFIQIGWWPTFNLADSAIVVGCLLLVIRFDTLRARNISHR